MRRSDRRFLSALLVTLAVFAVVFFGALSLLDHISTVSDESQMEIVKDAVHNAVITCYAVEGAYPPDVDYLVNNYGLAYDDTRFHVYYDAFASNIFPEIQVYLKGADEN